MRDFKIKVFTVLDSYIDIIGYKIFTLVFIFVFLISIFLGVMEEIDSYKKRKRTNKKYSLISSGFAGLVAMIPIYGIFTLSFLFFTDEIPDFLKKNFYYFPVIFFIFFMLLAWVLNITIRSCFPDLSLKEKGTYGVKFSNEPLNHESLDKKILDLEERLKKEKKITDLETQLAAEKRMRKVRDAVMRE